MITIQAKGKVYGVKHFVLDAVEDFNLLRKDLLFMGSTAYVISTGEKYIVNGNREWVLMPNSSSGGSGGEAEHILTINEMPNHTHQLKTDIESPDYNITWPEYFEYNEGWVQGPAEETESPPTHTTYTGGGQAHNNMPPYLTVSIWKRIS